MDNPRHLPCQALDHGTGYLAAFGAMVGLARRAQSGGSYRVRLALAQTGRWLDGLGRVDGQNTPDLTDEDVADLMQTTPTPFGEMVTWRQRPSFPRHLHTGLAHRCRSGRTRQRGQPDRRQD